VSSLRKIVPESNEDLTPKPAHPKKIRVNSLSHSITHGIGSAAHGVTHGIGSAAHGVTHGIENAAHGAQHGIEKIMKVPGKSKEAAMRAKVRLEALRKMRDENGAAMLAILGYLLSIAEVEVLRNNMLVQNGTTNSLKLVVSVTTAILIYTVFDRYYEEYAIARDTSAIPPGIRIPWYYSLLLFSSVATQATNYVC
jgi:hypothetical protein